MDSKLKNYFHLHLIVFIWGFTAVLGKLITIEALNLVWYRMGIAAIFVLIYLGMVRIPLKVTKRTFLILMVAGLALAIHWVTFFLAIKVSNVSIALATMSTGAFFTAILEPLWYRKKIVWYELVLGAIVILGLGLIFKVESSYGYGMLIAIISALMGVVFTLINSELVQKEKPSVIAWYELSIGVLLITILLAVQGKFDDEFFQLSTTDWVFMIILASVCTAYAFIGGVKVMKFVAPYTVILTVNLEPVYGIILAFFILGESERMNPMFYLGAAIIISTVIANGVIKNRDNLKKSVN